MKKSTKIKIVYTYVSERRWVHSNVATPEPEPEPVPNTPPVVTVVGDNPLEMTYGRPYPEYGATSYDAEDGDITDSIVIVNPVDVNTAGTYVVTYYSTDSAGATASATRSVVVAAAANTLPTIALVGLSALSIPNGGPYIEYGATASDVEDGDLTASIVTTSTVDVNVAGTYTVTYRVTDSGGASASVTRTVTVAAYYNNPPTIALVGSSSLSLPFGGPYTEYGATATDTEDGNITANIVTTSNVNVNVAGSYTVTYQITDSGGASASVVRYVAVAAAAPSGYFISPTGLATNAGTYASPWDIKSALTTQSVPPGSTVYALPGTYTARPSSGAESIESPEYPGQTENIYQITRPGVTLKPYGATHSNPYPAIFEFGLQATADDIVFEYLYCRNPTAIPVSEPTISGSPYPGHPAAAPAGWAYWGSGGTISISPLGQVDGITIRNCVMNGGAGGISSFNCTSLTLDGNIFFDVGWEAVDRHHGHCHYMRNGGQTNDPADRCYLTRCLISSSNQRLTTGSGSLTLYSQSEIVENFELTKSWVKGTSIVQSTQLYARNMEYADMVFEAAAIGDNFDNITFGRPTSADDDFTLTNLTVINARKLADTDNITNLTQTNIRQIKTRALYTRTAMDPGETGTFVNAYTTPTADEVYIWPLDDTTVLHVHILDLDLDGTVAVDLAGYATSVQSYLLFHYLDPRTVLASGSLSSSLILNLTVRETNPVNGLLDSTDAYIIRLIPS
jgi:hypothetical protein